MDQPRTPGFIEVSVGAFIQAIALYRRQGGTEQEKREKLTPLVIERRSANRTTFLDRDGNELGRTIKHRRSEQCQAARPLQPFVSQSSKSNINLFLVN